MSISKKGLFASAGVAVVSLVAAAFVAVSPANATSAACASIGAGYLPQSGATVKLFTSILEPELSKYVAATKPFTDCTGIKVVWEGTNQFESLLPVRVAGGNAPDIAVIPQPGLLKKMVDTGKAVPAPAKTVNNVNRYWSKSWRDLGSVGGVVYAAPNSANNKSLVWYSPKQFAANGWTVPTTWTDLFKLSDKMVAAGKTPWCAGIASGAATGWPATDWVEETVVRLYGAKVYNNWINGTVKFSGPEIQKAMSTVAGWLQNPKYVGDVKAIATTKFQDAGLSIPKGTGCQMLQQASFYAAQYPAGTTISPTGDVWAFYLPTINPAVQTPVEGGGEFMLAFNKNVATQELQNYLSSPEYAHNRIVAAGKDGGWLTANSGVSLSDYQNPLDALMAKYLADKNGTFVFDASDATKAAVNAAEWTEFTAWFATGKSQAAVAASIDSNW